ncbi:MAG: hypothetical protein WC662_01220 [Candidatus Paceibacterota bacterium]|jgi:chromosome segregation ATPase
MDEQKIQNYIKQVRNEANEDMKLHLGALNEIHGENLKAIRESFTLVNKKLDDHTKILDEHTKVLGEHTRILSSHTEMIGELKEDVSELKSDIKEVKGDLKNKTDYSEFLVLKNKVSLGK